MGNLEYAVFLAIALASGLIVREAAKARVADRLGDPTPRLHGRLRLPPHDLVDPLGTLILPGLILLLVATGASFVPPAFAYAKQLPLEPSYHRNGNRDELVIHLAGPVANLLLAAVAGLLLRVGVRGTLGLLTYAFTVANLFMCVFQLLPIPGLDGSKLLSLVLPPRPREVFSNLDPYLPLFMLVIFFFLGGLLFSIVQGITGGLCRALTGFPACPWG